MGQYFIFIDLGKKSVLSHLKAFEGQVKIVSGR